MSKTKKKSIDNLVIVQVLEIFLVIFWVLSWLNGYIKEGVFIHFNLLLVLIIIIAIFLIIKSSKLFKLLWFLVLLASIGGSVLMLIAYNLSVNLQY